MTDKPKKLYHYVEIEGVQVLREYLPKPVQVSISREAIEEKEDK